MTTTGCIGVIGLGEMGATVAARLHAVGADLLVHDANLELMAQWPQELWAPGIAALAARCGTVLVIVATDEHALDVADQLAAAVTPGTVVVLHSTVAPATAIEAHARLAAVGAHLMDAGMSRGNGRMSEGCLTLFVGGNEAVIDMARPVLGLYSDNVVHAGDVGAGMVVKLCNNLALHGNRMILLEAGRIAAAAGVSPDILVSGVTTSTGSSWVAHHWGRTDDAALRDGSGQTPMTGRTNRELDLMLALANTLKVEVPTAALVAKRLPSVLERGLAATDRNHLMLHKQARVQEWRDARDKAGPPFWSPLLVLTTTGAQTGRPRTCVLSFAIYNERLFVFASNGGRRSHPDWFRNLSTHPQVTVEIGSASVVATAIVLPDDEAEQVYRQHKAANPSYTRYESEAAGRRIPVIQLQLDTPLDSILPSGR
jgi:deazaflavin-dependent oxidoreductase (nitroreductase family)